MQIDAISISLIETRYLRSRILSRSMNEPPKHRERGCPGQDDRIPIHVRQCGHRVNVRKTKEDVEENDQHASDPVDHQSEFAHREPSRWYVSSSCQDVWEYCEEVTRGREDDE